jgi:hypothetical protein
LATAAHDTSAINDRGSIEASPDAHEVRDVVISATLVGGLIEAGLRTEHLGRPFPFRDRSMARRNNAVC